MAERDHECNHPENTYFDLDYLERRKRHINQPRNLNSDCKCIKYKRIWWKVWIKD